MSELSQDPQSSVCLPFQVLSTIQKGNLKFISQKSMAIKDKLLVSMEIASNQINISILMDYSFFKVIENYKTR